MGWRIWKNSTIGQKTEILNMVYYKILLNHFQNDNLKCLGKKIKNVIYCLGIKINVWIIETNIDIHSNGCAFVLNYE